MNINEFCTSYLARIMGTPEFEQIAAAYVSKGYVTEEQLQALDPQSGEFTETEMNELVANVLAQPPVDAMISHKVDALMTYMGVTGTWNGNVFEITKPTEFPVGDYQNPIQWTDGMPVESGKFYWYDDYDMRLMAEDDGTPEGWALPPFEQL